METIAVYWEPVVRVYGYDIKRNIELITIEVALDQLEAIGELTDQLARSANSFTMTLLQQAPRQMYRIYIATAADEGSDILNTFTKISLHDNDPGREEPQKVELLSFHGPHFQDRYGIAEATFSGLAESDIQVYVAGCTGTSVYLLVAEGQAETARDILSASFVVPQPSHRRDLLSSRETS